MTGDELTPPAGETVCIVCIEQELHTYDAARVTIIVKYAIPCIFLVKLTD